MQGMVIEEVARYTISLAAGATRPKQIRDVRFYVPKNADKIQYEVTTFVRRSVS